MEHSLADHLNKLADLNEDQKKDAIRVKPFSKALSTKKLSHDFSVQTLTNFTAMVENSIPDYQIIFKDFRNNWNCPRFYKNPVAEILILNRFWTYKLAFKTFHTLKTTTFQVWRTLALYVTIQMKQGFFDGLKGVSKFSDKKPS